MPTRARKGDLMEKTLVLIKPDGIKRRLIGEILIRIERKKYKILNIKMIEATKEMLENHYDEHKDKKFFRPLIDFMMQGSIIALIVKGENAITGIRNMIGNSDPELARPGTIRGDFASNDNSKVQKNLIHSSDSLESAKKEISIWFK